MKRRYLVGIGNYSMGDDGIGLRIAEHIAQAKLNSDFDVIEIGNHGLDLLSYLNEDVEKMLWVDCVPTGRAPGETIFFAPEDVESVKKLSGSEGVSPTTHEGDMLQILNLARSLGQHIPKIRVMGIEPEIVAPQMVLSKTLEARFPELVNEAIRQIRDESW